jgi:hypothetical protein
MKKIIFGVGVLAAMLAPALFASAASYPYTVSYNGTSITLTGDTTLTCTGNAPPYGIMFNTPNASPAMSWNGAGITCNGSTQYANGGNNGWGMSAIGSNLAANFGDVQNTLYTLYGYGDFKYYLDGSNTVVLVPDNFSFITYYTLTYTAGANGTLTGSTTQSVESGANGSAVEAVPNAGYHFTEWSDMSVANPRIDDDVLGDITVSAEFSTTTAPAAPVGAPIAFPTSTGNSFLAFVGGQVADPGLLLVVVIAAAVPLTFYVIKQLIQLIP